MKFTSDPKTPINNGKSLHEEYRALLIHLRDRDHSTIEESCAFLETCLVQMYASTIASGSITYNDACARARSVVEQQLIALKYLIQDNPDHDKFLTDLAKLKEEMALA